MLVRRLFPHERHHYAAHLKRLTADDRLFRFAHVGMSDERIDSYVAGIAADDVVLVAFAGGRVVGAAHVGLSGGMAEIGISVEAGHRGRGLGAELMGRAGNWARNRGAERLYTLCQTDNRAMTALAGKLGMEIHRDCGTAEAFLPLPPADFATVSDELSAGLDTVLHDWADLVQSCSALWLVRPGEPH